MIKRIITWFNKETFCEKGTCKCNPFTETENRLRLRALKEAKAAGYEEAVRDLTTLEEGK